MTESYGEHHEAGAAHRLERLVFFSDAVFAIAITLLVIELHPPHLPHGADDRAFLQALAGMIPDFFGFVLSFFVIGAFWAGHHRAFAFAAHWDQRLIGANLQMLCAVAAMPFFTALNNGNWTARVPVALYCGVLVLIALLNIRLQRLVTSAPVIDADAPPAAVANIRARGLAVLAGSLTGFGISLFAPPLGAMALATILPWRILLARLAARKRAHDSSVASFAPTRSAAMTDDRNLSTEHQKPGDTRRPSDTLDRPADQVHPAAEFDSAADVGKAEPGKTD